MFPTESLESFTERVKNGTPKTVKYRNYFAQLRPIDRVSLRSSKPSTHTRRISKEERLAILLEIL